MSHKSEASRQTTATEDSLHVLIDTTPAFIHTALPDGALDFLNHSWSEYIGLSLTDLLGWRWTTAIHSEDVEEFVAKWRAAIASGEPFVAESRVRRADGEYRWFLHRKVPLRDETGKIVKWCGSSLEIQDRKRADEEMLRSEAYLSEAQRLSHTGSFGWDLLTGEIYWSDETFRIFDLEPKTKITTDLILQRTHPDDRQAVQQVIERASSERTEFALEHRLLMPDGSIKYLRVVGRPSKDEGRRSEFVGAVTDITDQRHAEESLRKSEAYLADAQRLSQTGSWAWSPEEGIKYWSEQTYRVQSFDARDGLPRFEELFQRIHPDDQPRLRELMETLSREKNDVETDYRIVHPGGTVRDIHTTCHPVIGPSGELIEVIGTVMDVTERKRAGEELTRSEAYLAEAQKLSHTGSFGCKFSSGEMFWSEETFAIFGYNRATTPAAEAILERVHPEDKARVQENMHRAASDGKGCDLEYRLLMPDDSVKHVHVVAHAANDEPGRFEFVGAVVDVTDSKRAEEELRRSEAYLAEAQKVSHTGSWAWSPDKDIGYWSEECYRVLGFDSRDGVPRFEQLLHRVHPDDQPGMSERVQRMRREKIEVETDYRIVHPDGAVRNIHSTCHPILSPSGELTEFVGTVIDTTERKRAEEALRASERKYRYLVDTTPAFIHTALPNGDLDFFNRGWLEYVGLPLSDLLGWGWTSMMHPEDLETIVPKWCAAVEAGEPLVGESRVRRADGEYRWFLHREEPLRNKAGEIVKWYGSSIEIEERKTAEDKIRAQETELRQILELSPQHIAVYGPDGAPLYVNHVGLEYFGITLDQSRASSRINLVHPDDRERFLAERENRFLEGAPHEFEVRLMRHDGESRHFLIRQIPVKDERGQIIRWYGTATDIEDRKRAEDETKKENIVLREEIDKTSMFEEIVGVSVPLQSVLTDVSKVAPTNSTVLITGETGTGKELVARAIHKRSRRSARPFVSVNCAAIPSSLITSELFGHEKGAFTGATQRRQGRFELAEGGTIFLDEVGELPPEAQIALLRVLQEREFERVGGGRPIRADVRVIAATNRDLESAITEKTFRSDLYYRLNVFPVLVPPLRERRDDIPLLVEYFLHRFAKRAGKRINKIRKETLNIVESYDWPGNVRELQNVVERAVIVSESDALDVDERWLLGERTAIPFAAQPIQRVYRPRTQATQEKEAIETALMECKGRVSGPFGAASQLGIPSSTLESKIKALKIDKRTFKQQ